MDELLPYFPDCDLYIVTGSKGVKPVWVDKNARHAVQAAKAAYRYGPG